MKRTSYIVYFSTGKEEVNAVSALEALMMAMINRGHLQDKFASHVVDEYGNKYDVNNDLLLRVLS